ncbi:MAG: hypothetical protein KJ011_01370 [Burkholderiaceae bacterium]|nr:hypothetical protein [Burkholderiaceae bacterium]
MDINRISILFQTSSRRGIETGCAASAAGDFAGLPISAQCVYETSLRAPRRPVRFVATAKRSAGWGDCASTCVARRGRPGPLPTMELPDASIEEALPGSERAPQTLPALT